MSYVCISGFGLVWFELPRDLSLSIFISLSIYGSILEGDFWIEPLFVCASSVFANQSPRVREGEREREENEKERERHTINRSLKPEIPNRPNPTGKSHVSTHQCHTRFCNTTRKSTAAASASRE